MNRIMVWIGTVLPIAGLIGGCAGMNNTGTDIGNAPGFVGNVVRNETQPNTQTYRGVPGPTGIAWRDQIIRMDSVHKRVTVTLVGTENPVRNRQLDRVPIGQRLHIVLPTGWTVQSGLPTNSQYHVEIVPFTAPTGTAVQATSNLVVPAPQGARHSSSLKVQHAGTYAIVLRAPQQQPQVLDTLRVSTGQVPSVSTAPLA